MAYGGDIGRIGAELVANLRLACVLLVGVGLQSFSPYGAWHTGGDIGRIGAELVANLRLVCV